MDFDDTPEEAAFRQEVRSWLTEHAKKKEVGQLSSSHSFYDFDDVFVTDGKAWQRRLFDGGWAGITWPVEFGGRGGDVVQSMIFRQEEAQFDVTSGLFAVAMGMAGRTLIGHGNDEQRSRSLPAMLGGEEVWCQLFSEPGAGSDLASLTTRAERDGDEWVVNGQKVWTSYAHVAKGGILLARTDPTATKHTGISYFVCPMDAPGIEIRPLIDMTGEHAFNEVFFDDVRIPADHLVGPEHGGWELAKVTLGNERVSLSGEGALWGMGPTADDLIRWVAAEGGAPDPVRRDALVSVWVESPILRVLRLRMVSAVLAGRDPGAEASVRKAIADAHGQHVMGVARDLAGARGMLLEPGDVWARGFLFSPALTVGGGTAEVQRNIVAEKVLGLPRDP